MSDDIRVEPQTEGTPPKDAREYVLWKALSEAPFPHWKRPTGFHFDKRITWEDVDWINSYINWFAGTRLPALRASDLDTMQRRALLIERENQDLRELLVKARAALDNKRLVQEIDDLVGALQEDIDL